MGLDTMFKLRTTIKAIEQRPLLDKYDVIVVGAGPAGITAAIYLARYGLNTIVVSKNIGGYVSEAPIVDDYPGLPEISGNDLVDRFIKHLRKYNIPLLLDEVTDIYRDPENEVLWCIKLKNDPRKICSYAIILAVGSEKRKLDVKGERELLGKGISYCATCDGPLFKDRVVAVVGGGNSALISSLYLSNIASKVYLIHRRDSFRAFKIYVEAAESNPKIEIILNTVVTEIIGDEKLRAIRIRNVKTNEEKVIEVDGLFVEIGLNPPTEFFEKIGLEIDEEGRAKTNIDKSTNLTGIYVAGDAAGGPYKYKFEQIITSAAEGAIAADAAAKYVMTLKHRSRP